ncbi:hydroxyacid dehydrogenase [Fusobacterium sp. 1001295B_180824_G3]|uniref:hydroxyacid dehydrogenase n=1 Tax=Fusobacterium sp. 1001295B_180824_G3 TaxID=2787123 RepID=UPI00189AA577|nr:hydroxyacid dehydrogenase [Fusobacterium sp. 1001295B_180824_G3]
MGWKILLPQDIAIEARKYLQDKGHELIMGSGIDEQSICNDIKDIDAMVVRTAKIPASVFEAANKLKVIVRHGAGYDGVDIEAAKKHGVKVLYCPQANSISVAETVMMLMLCCSRNFTLAHKLYLDDYYTAKMKIPKFELEGKTVGIISCGKIGSLVAEKCMKGFNMKVMAWDPYKPVDTFPKGVKVIEDINDIFKECDFISVHSPLTEETREFIGKKQFEMMKPTTFFINSSRGKVVNEKDLYEACKNNVIAGAGLDVLQEEPFNKENPIFQLDNVVITPHIGAATKEATTRASMQCAQGIQEVYEGKKPTWPVPGF